MVCQAGLCRHLHSRHRAGVGVTVGAIYVHFPSKGRLLVAVYEEGVGRIGRAVDAALVAAEARLGATGRGSAGAPRDAAGAMPDLRA